MLAPSWCYCLNKLINFKGTLRPTYAHCLGACLDRLPRAIVSSHNAQLVSVELHASPQVNCRSNRGISSQRHLPRPNSAPALGPTALAQYLSGLHSAMTRANSRPLSSGPCSLSFDFEIELDKVVEHTSFCQKSRMYFNVTSLRQVSQNWLPWLQLGFHNEAIETTTWLDQGLTRSFCLPKISRNVLLFLECKNTPCFLALWLQAK